MATSQGPECPVCCESFDGQDVSPRMLSCGHSFCTGCLERLLATVDTITCPTCRVEVKVPQAGVAGLPKNWALLSLIAPDHEGVDGLPICEFCENKHPANSYCLDCEEDMCKNAARFHTRNKTSRDHRIVSLEPSAVFLKCPKHDEQFRLFDVKRNCMICRSCFTSFRDRHVVSLAEAGSKCKVKLQELATKARSRAEVIKAGEARVKDASLDAKTSCDEQRDQIEGVFQKLRAAITAREEILVHELEQLQKSKEAVLAEQQERICQFRKDIESTVQDVLKRVQSLDNANLLATSSDLEATLAALEKQPHPVLEPEAQLKQFVPVFSFDGQRLQSVQDAIKTLGTVIDQGHKSERRHLLFLKFVSLFAICFFIFKFFYSPSSSILIAIIICFVFQLKTV